jgi:hypothetical protein
MKNKEEKIDDKAIMEFKGTKARMTTWSKKRKKE